jgi:hypothetical protein
VNKAEAIVAMKAGAKVTHSFFTPEEWMTFDSGYFKFEDGCQCRPSQFWGIRQGPEWDDGWRIFTPATTSPISAQGTQSAG